MSTATSGSSGSTEDSWGLPSSSQILKPSQRFKTQAPPVPDDWDADDDEGEDGQDAQTIWEVANARTPMPQVQVASTAISAGAQLPPAAAFEAPLRILKRPSAAGSKSPSPSGGGPAQKSLQEREAQYQAARERIFGEEERGRTVKADNDKPKAHMPDKFKVIRDPKGPSSEIVDGETRHGFGARRKKGTPPPRKEPEDTSHGPPQETQS